MPLQLRPNRIMCDARNNMNLLFCCFFLEFDIQFFSFPDACLMLPHLSHSTQPTPKLTNFIFQRGKSEHGHGKNWVKCKFDSALAVRLHLTCKECRDRFIQLSCQLLASGEGQSLYMDRRLSHVAQSQMCIRVFVSSDCLDMLMTKIMRKASSRVTLSLCLWAIPPNGCHLAVVTIPK